MNFRKTTNAPVPAPRSTPVTACTVFGIAVAVAIAVGIALNAPDIAKYIKLKSM